MLAGPGTGKTTTLVEAIVRRIEDGADPSRVLALTFSRKAAEQLRDRVTARLGRTLSTQLSSTFHSFAYGLVRLHAPAELYAAPLRLLSAPEQDVVLQELLTDNPESVTWPEQLRAAVGTRGFAREVHAVLSRARERGLDPDDLVALGRAEKVPGVRGRRAVPAPVPRRPRRPVRDRLPRPHRPRGHRGQPPPRRAPGPVQPRLRRRVPGHRPRPGRAAPRAGRRRPRPDRRRRPRPVDLRLPRRRGARHPRLPRASSRPPTAAPRRSSRWAPPAASARGCCGPRATSPPRSRSPAPSRPRRTPRSASPSPPTTRSDPAASRCSPSTPPAPRPRTSPTCSAGPTSRTASAGPRWRCWSAPAGPPSRRCAARWAPPACRSRWPPTTPRWSASPRCCRCWARSPWSSTPEIDDPHHDDFVGADRVEALLTSPLGGLDATDVRSLTRAMRARDRATPARELVRRAVLEPASLEGLDGEPARRATRLAGLLADARAALADGSTVEEVLWVLWDGSDWGRRLRQATQAGGQARPPRAPRPRRDLRALRERRPRRGAEGPHQRPLVRRDAALPGDPRRHPRRPRRPRRRRTPAHRPPLQGPGVAAGGRRPGPGGRLAGPAPPGHAAARRPDRPRRAAAADHHPRAAGRGAPAVLRRRDPRQAAPRRHRGRVARRTTASSPRASCTSSAAATSRCTASGARAGRCRWPGWWPSSAVPSPTPTSPSRSAAPPPGGCGSWPTPTCTAARSRPAPTRRPGGGSASRAAPSDRCARRTSR